MSIMMTIADTAAWLGENDNYLILTHRRPDGDTVGCAGALAQGLREAGKTAYVFNNTEITPRYLRFVADFIAPDGFDPDHVVLVDAASLNLFPKNSDKYTATVSLCIDHHPSNTLYAQRTCLDGSFSSCGEIIYEILIALSGRVSAETAGRLYAAVSTDTGCFAFSNTTANTLRVASLLIDAGAPHREINKLLFRTKTRSRIKLEGALYSDFEYYFEGAVAISIITLDMIEMSDATEDDMDDIASLPGVVEGVRVGITIREVSSPHDCKVSVRTSSPLVNANDVCERFGGGGHPMAAGFTVGKPVSEVKEALLSVLREFL